MKICILGASGFIGTRLTGLLLEAGHSVVIGDLVKSEKYPDLWQECDIRQKADLLRVCKGSDLIINLAAEHRDDVTPLSLYEEVNVDGSRRVCEAADELEINKIVFTSSVAIYGFPETELDELAPHNSFNEYGRTKWLAEGVYREWLAKDAKNRSLMIIRPTVVFGEANRGNVYNLLKQIASGKFLMIGNGTNKKSMAYVGNVAAFLKWNTEKNGVGEHLYNYIDKPDLGMNDLIKVINQSLDIKPKSNIKIPYFVGWCGGLAFDILAKLTGKKFPISRIRIKKFCSQTIFSSAKMQASGFKPPYSLEKGLDRTLKHEFKS